MGFGSWRKNATPFTDQEWVLIGIGWCWMVANDSSLLLLFGICHYSLSLLSRCVLLCDSCCLTWQVKWGCSDSVWATRKSITLLVYLLPCRKWCLEKVIPFDRIILFHGELPFTQLNPIVKWGMQQKKLCIKSDALETIPFFGAYTCDSSEPEWEWIGKVKSLGKYFMRIVNLR